MNEREPNLHSTEQRTVARWVSALPDEMPSMAWRSGLNEAILKESSKKKRQRRLFWFGGPASIAVATACVALLLVQPQIQRVQGSPGSAHAEDDLLTLHHQDNRIADVAGSGLAPFEATEEAVLSPESDVSEIDLEGV